MYFWSFSFQSPDVHVTWISYIGNKINYSPCKTSLTSQDHKISKTLHEEILDVGAGKTKRKDTSEWLRESRGEIKALAHHWWQYDLHHPRIAQTTPLQAFVLLNTCTWQERFYCMLIGVMIIHILSNLEHAAMMHTYSLGQWKFFLKLKFRNHS